VRRIFGTRRDEVKGGWSRLHNEELNGFLLLTQYCTGDKIEKNEMGWACDVYGRGGGCIGSWWENRRKGDYWGDLGVDGWIILGWISRGWNVGIWTRLGWPRIETGGGRF